MLNTILLAIAMINYSANSGPTSAMTYATTIEFKTYFNDSYYENGYTYNLVSEVYFDMYLEFNSNTDYQASIVNLDYHYSLNVYEGDALESSYTGSNSVSSTIVLGSFASGKQLQFIPASTPNGFAYRYVYDSVQYGYLFCQPMEYDIDYMNQFYFNVGNLSGYANLVMSDIGSNNFYMSGYNDGYTNGHDAGYEEGYFNGYVNGQANTMNPEMFTIFNGFLNVAMIPVNVFLGIFNFEVFGINIASLVASIFSIAILVIVIRLLVGASSKGD